MFASLTLEREPPTLSWPTFLESVNSWAQIVGGFAMVGLILWLIAYRATRRTPQDKAMTQMANTTTGTLLVVLLGPIGALILYWMGSRKGRTAAVPQETSGPPRRPMTLTTVLFIGSFVWAVFCYLLLLASYLPEIIHGLTSDTAPPIVPGWRVTLQDVLWTVAGASAIFAVLLPIFGDLGGISPRRVWAIARLSFKEAVRRKVLWVFLALLLVVLFGSWFIQNKPEDQVRTYVQVVFLAMAVVMLFLAALIAGFGIPDDIRHQTIHTVLTKPVHRFEIFLGRFLGYTVLMTAALVVVSGFGLLYVLRNINPEAAEESLKARDPLYGELGFLGTKGENVGREWDYRRYIIGKQRSSTDPTQYAVWAFPNVPAQLRDRDPARLEFALDIYRTHKGVEGQGIFCTFFVESWRFDANNPLMMEKYNARKRALQDSGDPDVEGRLAEEFGYYEFPSKEIQDFHTQSIEVPKGVFVNAARPAGEEDKDRVAELRRKGEWPISGFRVRVRCDSPAQFVGMARRDLYFRLDQDDPTGSANKARFCVNFFKGSFGLWLRLCLMIGLAVAASTYLSGVITLLTTGILYVLGFFQDFITEVALRKNFGGGPIEGVLRLVKKPGGEAIAGQLDPSTSTEVATGIDEAFSWGLRRVLNLIPDVANYSFTDFVAEGVSIHADQMAMAFLILLGYLLPWAVLAYYLLKWREVASST